MIQVMVQYRDDATGDVASVDVSLSTRGRANAGGSAVPGWWVLHRALHLLTAELLADEGVERSLKNAFPDA